MKYNPERYKQYYLINHEKELKRYKQYYLSNREKILKRHKQERERNSNYTKEYNKQYYLANKEKILERCKQYRKANVEHRKEYNRQWREANPERCKETHRQYRLTNREKILKRKKQYRLVNYEKILKRAEQYRLTNHEKILKHYKQWQENNPEYYKQWQENNPEYQNQWQKNRRKTDLKFNLNYKIKSAINTSLKGNKNGRHWEDLVGYTLEDLIKRLRKTMPYNYIWQDYMDGKLHLDHKIPISAFNFTKPEHIDFQRCWALKNLQLLPAKENLKKRDKLLEPLQLTFLI